MGTRNPIALTESFLLLASYAQSMYLIVTVSKIDLVLISDDIRVRCWWNICHNGGTCWKEGSSVTCQCLYDYTGKHCEGERYSLPVLPANYS